MKKYVSIVLAVVLLTAVAASMVSGMFASNGTSSFVDTELSTDNWMCAGTRTFTLTGGPLQVDNAVPCKYYSQEFTVVSTGTLDGKLYLLIPATDGSYGCADTWHGIKCIEAGDIDGLVYNGSGYISGSPVGPWASSEAEFVAEEGGQVGQITLAGLGRDAGSDSGPSWLVMSKHIDIKIWFDNNGDGDYDDAGECINLGTPPVKLNTIVGQKILLGTLPGTTACDNNRGGGWGSYFTYDLGSGSMQMPLVAGQNYNAGVVNIHDDGTKLYIDYDTSSTGWKLKETHVYVGIIPPPKLAPGQFKNYPPSPVGHENLGNVTTDSYQITLPAGWVPGTKVYIATHAVVCKQQNCGCWCETAWGMGVGRKVKIEVHLQQVQDPSGMRDYNGNGTTGDEEDQLLDYWPTDVFQGDMCIFDIVFWLLDTCGYCW